MRTSSRTSFIFVLFGVFAVANAGCNPGVTSSTQSNSRVASSSRSSDTADSRPKIDTPPVEPQSQTSKTKPKNPDADKGGELLSADEQAKQNEQRREKRRTDRQTARDETRTTETKPLRNSDGTLNVDRLIELREKLTENTLEQFRRSGPKDAKALIEELRRIEENLDKGEYKDRTEEKSARERTVEIKDVIVRGARGAGKK